MLVFIEIECFLVFKWFVVNAWFSNHNYLNEFIVEINEGFVARPVRRRTTSPSISIISVGTDLIPYSIAYAEN